MPLLIMNIIYLIYHKSFIIFLLFNMKIKQFAFFILVITEKRKKNTFVINSLINK